MIEQQLEGVLADFRRTAEVSLARIEGALALLLQRQEQSERRADAQDAVLAKLDTRIDQVERSHVTRDDLDKRSQRTIAWMGVIVGIVSILTATATTVVITLVNS